MPKIVDKQAKTQAIAAAAIKVFRQRGFHQTRMADVAAAAGVGKGTLYEYFQDKADILRFAFEDYFSTFITGATLAGSWIMSMTFPVLLEAVGCLTPPLCLWLGER